MKIKSHKFLLEVETTKTIKQAELDVLHAFALRKPDGCRFYLKRKAPILKKKSKVEYNNICANCGKSLTDHSEKLCATY